MCVYVVGVSAFTSFLISHNRTHHTHHHHQSPTYTISLRFHTRKPPQRKEQEDAKRKKQEEMTRAKKWLQEDAKRRAHEQKVVFGERLGCAGVLPPSTWFVCVSA